MDFLTELAALIKQRQQQPQQGSYTTKLFNDGLPYIARKVGEEAVEVVVAALKEKDEQLIAESADLLYHLLVLLAARDISPEQVVAEMKKRHADQ